MKIFDGHLPGVHELQALVSIMEEGTVTKAADKLGVSQSALSYTLEKMRAAFNDALFIRMGNRMEATSFAKRLRDPAVRVLNILALEMVKEKEFQASTTSATFRVGVNEVGAISLAPKLTAFLSRTAPRARLVTVHVRPEDVGLTLERDEVDVAVGYFPGTSDDVPHAHLFNTHAVCIARADHPKVGDSITLAQLARSPCVDTKLMTPVREMALVSAGEVLRTPFVYCAANHLPAIPLIVASTDLIAMVPIELYELFHKSFSLKRVRVEADLPEVGVFLYWHKRSAGDAANKFLRDAITHQLQ